MSRLSRNIIFNFFGQLLTLTLSFVAVRLVFRRLGDDALGIIYFTQTVSALLRASLSLGIDNTTVREVAGHNRDEPEYVRHWVRTAGLVFWSLTIALAAALWFLVPILVRHWINLTSMSEGEAIRALRILGIASLLMLPRTLYASVLRGLERMDVTNGVEVGILAVKQIGAIAILWRGGDFFDVVWWLAGCHVLFLVAYAVGVARLFSPSGLVPGFSTAAIRRNLRYAMGAMAITIFATVHTQGDKVIVSKLLPLGMLGIYAFASAAAWRGLLVAHSVSRAAFPAFSTLFGAEKRGALMLQYRKLQDLVCWALPPVFALLAFGAIPIFTFVFSREVAETMRAPVALLCLGIYMNGTATVPHILAMASGKPQIAARLNFWALLVVLPVTAGLIYALGLTGAALSWIWYHVFCYAYMIPQVCRYCCDFSVWAWYGHIARVYGAIAVTYGTAWGVLALLDARSIPALALAYAVATIAYAVIGWFMIGPELKATIRGHALRLARLVRRTEGAAGDHS